VGEPFRGVARFSVVHTCFELEDILDEVHNLDKTPLEGSLDVFIHEESPSLSFDNIVLPNPLDYSHISPIFLQPSPSPKYNIDTSIDNPMIFYANNDLGYENDMFSMLGGNVDSFMSLGYFSGYPTSLDPYYMYLVDAPRKIMWNTFFDLSFDFSIVCGLMRRALTFFNVLILMLSHYHACESYAVMFDKLLRALTESDLMS